MPTTKHKRKTTPHSKSKTVKRTQSAGVITSNPKVFITLGLLFVVLGVYLLAFESHDNAMFGVAMLSLIAGIVTVVYAKLTAPKKNTD